MSRHLLGEFVMHGPPTQKLIADSMSEDALLNNVVRCARLNGWLVHHSRPAMNRRGKWSTAIMGDKGLPDLILARSGDVIFAELKSMKGSPSIEQRGWLYALSADDSPRLNRIDRKLGVSSLLTVVLWKPSHWLDGSIEARLK